MTRKSDSHPASAAKAAAQLKALRSQIDKLDHQILKLLNERAARAAEAGQIKSEQANEIFAPAREEEILQNLLHSHKGPLDVQTIRAIFRELMSGSRALQKVLKVAYLGPEYSNCHLAVIERFGTSIDFIGVGSIPAVFEEVNRGHADFGIVPLENSIDGRLSDTLEMFLRLPQIHITSEVRFRIHHHLMANVTQQEIRRIYSRSQILSQCRNWLSKNVPHAQIVEVTSTGVAGELAQREPGAAAVASRHVAQRFGLKILFEQIEDSLVGISRFAVVGNHPAPRGGKDKTALLIHLGKHPGSLADALNIFKQNKVNIGVIESYMARSGKDESVFFLDFEGHMDEPKSKRTIEALHKRCEKVTVLGSFPASIVNDE